MTIILQHRRGTTTESDALTGAEGELFVDLDKNTVVIHDGTTEGGHALPTFTDLTTSSIDSFARSTANSATSLAQSAYNYANTIVSDTQIDQYARTTANGANGLAAGAYSKANSATSLAQSAYNFANTIVSDTQIDPYARTTANGANGLAAGAFAAANTKFNSSGGTISGSVTLNGNLNVSGNTITTRTAEANVIIVDTTLYSGLASRSAVLLPNLIAQFASNSNTYIQVNAQNIDPQGSADYVITADNGSDTDFYLDMGMLGSQYNNQYAYNSLGTAGTPYDGYLYVQGSTIGQIGGNLIIGTTSTTVGQDIKFIVGGSNTEHIIVRMTHDGLIVNGTISASGGIIDAVDSYARTTANTAGSLAQVAFNQANTSAQTIPQNAQSGTYTLQRSDAGKHLYYTNGSAVSLYIPWTSNTSFANGTTITIISNTSSNVTITPNNGVSMYLAGNTTSSSRNVTTYGMATLIMTAANTWYINGSGVV